MIMRGFIRKIPVLFFLCGILIMSAYAVEWKELSSDHFIIYYSGDRKFAKGVADKAEYYYRRIAADLGYPRYSNFWTWDNRAKIYIYPDQSNESNPGMIGRYGPVDLAT